MVPRVCLIHWNAAEAAQRAEVLRANGYQADVVAMKGMTSLKSLGDDPPVAILIGLDRLPMQGRDVGMALRVNKGTRLIPLIFAGGDPKKVARVKESLPDASYVTWEKAGEALRRAVGKPHVEPIVPKSVLAGYAGSPLEKKLGIHAGSMIAFVEAPEGFAELAVGSVQGVRVEDRPSPKCDLLFWFVRSGLELDRNMDVMAGFVQAGSMWMFWPKRTAGVDSGLSPERLRTAAMAAGLVDYKICSVDATWSGMLFTRRKK